MSLKSKISGLVSLVSLAGITFGVYDGISTDRIGRNSEKAKQLQRDIKRGSLTGFSMEDIGELEKDYKKIEEEEREYWGKYSIITGTGVLLSLAGLIGYKSEKD